MRRLKRKISKGIIQILIKVSFYGTIKITLVHNKYLIKTLLNNKILQSKRISFYTIRKYKQILKERGDHRKLIKEVCLKYTKNNSYKK